MTDSAPAIPQTPPPGWTTSEFLTTVGVHCLSLLAILLDLLHVHWSRGLSSAQAEIPMVAIAVSGLMQAAYSNRRTALKMTHVAESARVIIAKAQIVAPAVSNLEHAVAVIKPQPAAVVSDIVINQPASVPSPVFPKPAPAADPTVITDPRQ